MPVLGVSGGSTVVRENRVLGEVDGWRTETAAGLLGEKPLVCRRR